jgi:DNA-binding LacI/PurR family transcriptional regulator
VLLGREIEGLDSLTLSYYEGACTVMDHLLGLGHRRISFVRSVAQATQGQDRLQAYHDKMHSAGLVDHIDVIDHRGTTIQNGYDAAMTLLERGPRPTAIVAINDLVALGVLRALSAHGLAVPGDVSVAAFDDTPFAAFSNPPLSTVRVEATAIGHKTAVMLVKRLQNPKLPPQVEHMSTAGLMLRESTGPVPN